MLGKCLLYGGDKASLRDSGRVPSAGKVGYLCSDFLDDSLILWHYKFIFF